MTTAAALESQLPVPTLTTSAEDPVEEAASAEAVPSTTVSVPSTTEVLAPTSTWVVFEEVEEPPAPRVFDRVRVPQSEGDVKGAFYWYPSGIHGPTAPPKVFEHAGAVFDACRVEDGYFEAHGRYRGFGAAPSGEFKRDWFRWKAPDDCRGPAQVLERPLLGVWPGRYFTFDDEGQQSPYLVSPQEALEWYAAAVGEYGENESSIPAGMLPAGTGAAVSSYGGPGSVGSSVPTATASLIEYSGVADLLDEVRVLPGTVAVGGDGVLRGLVRNWSRTMWAYGVTVAAGGAEWVWPLSIQPGEAAPFEIEIWRGPADPALIDFRVSSEMSNDADLSRAWFFWFDHFYRDDEHHFGNRPAADRYVFERLSPLSHPSGGEEWAPWLVLDLALYVADLNPDGTVADVRSPEFDETGPFRDKDRYDPHDDSQLSYCDGLDVARCFPGEERWVGAVKLYVDNADDYWETAFNYSFVAWVGMPHHRAG
ncbi:hypothetical protein [Candidatus Poriferisodalis sp.]|uniref:hypothetical protein n=1 Tax=Candidatus Poriferisodalis sp. TaxID=3101277 RepID=UPI003B01976C